MRDHRPYRGDLEGLRGVAVALVVLYHYELLGFGGGYVAVDLFFVLSGFLISGLLVEEMNRSGTIAVGRFWARRTARLLPVATLVIVCTVVACAFLLPPILSRDFAMDGIYASTYLTNLRMAFRAVDYFATDLGASPLQHYWSLSLEEQFYFLWPLVLLPFARKKRLLATLLVGLALVSFGFSIWLTRTNQPWAYFSLPSRMWAFCAGGLLALAPGVLAGADRRLVEVLAASGLGAVLASGLIYSDATPYPGVAALVPVFGATFLIAAGTNHAPFVLRFVVGSRGCRFLGRISYSLYLWHWPLLAVPTLVADEQPTMPYRVGLVLLSIALSYATFKLVEDPIRRSTLWRRDPWSAAGLGVTATLVAVSVSAVILGMKFQKGLDRPLTPTFADLSGDLPRIYKDGCHVGFNGFALQNCVYGNPDAGRSIFLVGDSHAAHWFPALENIALEKDRKLIVQSKSACPFTTAKVARSETMLEYHDCEAWRRNVLARIHLERPDLLVISNSRKAALVDAKGALVPPKLRFELWRQGLSAIISEGLPAARRVVVLGDIPRPTRDIPRCIAQFGPDAQECSIPTGVATDRAWSSAERAVVEGMGAVYVDPTSWVCPKPTCLPIQNGILLFRDSHHLTATFALGLSRKMQSELF